jgi:SAM-dependent methyltransferase
MRTRIDEGVRALLPDLISLWRDPSGTGVSLPRGSTSLSPREIAGAGAALLRLQRGLTGDRSLAGAAYMEDSDQLGAYLLYYWPISYIQISLALAELSLRPRRLLDLGSGPGPAAFAVFDSDVGLAMSEIVLADSSPAALRFADRLFEARNTGPAARRPAPEIRRRVLDLESVEALPEGPFDLVILGHCLNELWRDHPDRGHLRLRLLERAAELLSHEGALLVLEPATLAASREALSLRDALAERGFGILGPCPGSYPCPAIAAGPDRSCHAEAPWAPIEPLASLAAKAGLDRRSVKCTWFAASKGGARPAELTASVSAADIARGRVVSDSMLNKAGRLRYFVCSDGALRSVSARRDDPLAAAAGFPGLARGDWIRLRGAERREGGGLGLATNSSLDILSRAPVP